jgi:hypothetical protein
MLKAFIIAVSIMGFPLLMQFNSIRESCQKMYDQLSQSFGLVHQNFKNEMNKYTQP